MEQKKINYLNYILFAVTLLLLGILKFGYHEFWKDEWQAWLIATDTPDLESLFSILPVEGHPSLWFLLLRSVNIVAGIIIPGIPKEYVIQVFHFLLTATTLYILFIRIRLPLVLKTGFAFSYFLFFEYGVVNRSYMLVCLITFLLTLLADSPKKNFIFISIVILLLTQTEVYALFVAFAFLFLIIPKLKLNAVKLSGIPVLLPVFTFLLGCLLFYVTVSGTAGSADEETTVMQSSMSSFFSAFQSLLSNTFWIGFIPSVKEKFDVSNFFISAIILTAIIFIFKNKKVLLVTYLVFFITLLFFSSVLYAGGPRQWGIHFIFFIALLHHVKTGTRSEGVPAIKIETYFLYGLSSITILFQLSHCLKIVNKEKDMLFSNAINAGRYIRNNIPADAPIVAINKAFATPVIGYSGHKFYSLPEKEKFSYFIFKEKMYLPAMEELLQFKNELHAADLYVLSYKPLNIENYKQVEPMLAFNNASIREESYFLYRVK